MYSHLAKGFDQLAADNAAEVNRRKLNSCSHHFFDCIAIDWRRKVAPETLRCVMCGGVLPFLEAEAYARGHMHAGGDPEAVLPGFTH